MSTRILAATVAAAALAFGLAPGTAWAEKPVFNVSGKVTAVPIGRKITVNGRTYRIAAGSQARKQVNQLARGDTVRVILDGPPGSRSSKVVAIHATPGR